MEEKVSWVAELLRRLEGIRLPLFIVVSGVAWLLLWWLTVLEGKGRDIAALVVGAAVWFVVEVVDWKMKKERAKDAATKKRQSYWEHVIDHKMKSETRTALLERCADGKRYIEARHFPDPLGKSLHLSEAVVHVDTVRHTIPDHQDQIMQYDWDVFRIEDEAWEELKRRVDARQY